MQILPGKFNINCPRAMTIDLVTGVRRKVTVIVWPANPAFLHRGNTALVNWSES